MPEVIDRRLFPPQTSIPPGESIGTDPIDVSGAQHLTVNVLIHGPGANVERTILFVHRDPTGVGAMPVKTDTFGPEREPGTAALMTLVPVYGTELQVILTNKGSEPVKTGVSWVYGVREASEDRASQ